MKCPVCGFDGNKPHQKHCSLCGNSLAEKIPQQPEPADPVANNEEPVSDTPPTPSASSPTPEPVKVETDTTASPPKPTPVTPSSPTADVPAPHSFILRHRDASKYHRAGDMQKVTADRAELGCNPDCPVRFDQDTWGVVSRRHAAIERDGDQWKIIHLSATNSTFINGKKIEKVWFLKNGDEIQLAAKGPRLVFTDPEAEAQSVPEFPSVFGKKTIRAEEDGLYSPNDQNSTNLEEEEPTPSGLDKPQTTPSDEDFHGYIGAPIDPEDDIRRPSRGIPTWLIVTVVLVVAIILGCIIHTMFK